MVMEAYYSSKPWGQPIQKLGHQVKCILEEAENKRSFSAMRFIEEIYRNMLSKTDEIKELEQERHEWVKHRQDYQRLTSIAGVGPIIVATIMVSVNSPDSFKKDCQLAVWMGLPPSLYSRGETTRMGRFTKRGNQYLRKLLIHDKTHFINSTLEQ